MIMKNETFKKNARLFTLKTTIILLIVIVMLSLSGASVQANSVEYRGEAEGLIATPEDFFLDFGTLLPGDKREGVAYIKNTTNDEIEVFFKTEPLDRSEYYDDIDYSLLEKISLKISLKKNASSDEQVLYEGNLGAVSMSEFRSLGSYSKGYDGEFIFRIEVPTSLRNDYTLSRTKVKWVFAVEKKEKDKPEPENTDEKQDDKNQNPVEEIIEQVQTGDRIYFVIGIMIIAVLMAITLYIPKNKRRK